MEQSYTSFHTQMHGNQRVPNQLSQGWRLFNTLKWENESSKKDKNTKCKYVFITSTIDRPQNGVTNGRLTVASPIVAQAMRVCVQPHWNQVWVWVVNIANIAWARNTAWFPRVQRVQPTERSIVETCGELCSGCGTYCVTYVCIVRDKHTEQTHVTNCVTYVCIVPVKDKHTRQTHVTNKCDVFLHCAC